MRRPPEQITRNTLLLHQTRPDDPPHSPPRPWKISIKDPADLLQKLMSSLSTNLQIFAGLFFLLHRFVLALGYAAAAVGQTPQIDQQIR